MNGYDIATVARTLGGEVRGGAALVPGPGHSSKDRSLSIKLTREDFVVFSFAGDDAIVCRDYVRQAMGWPPWEPRGEELQEKPRRARPHGRERPIVIGDDDGPPRRTGELRRHFYRCDGESVRVKVKIGRNGATRYENWYRDSSGWRAKKPDGYVSVPYVGAIDPFDPAIAGDAIAWPEGEKDVDTLARHNVPAFTFGGTGDGLPTEAGACVAGRHIVILADNDDPGHQHAERKAALAHAAGAASVKVIHFAELAPREDVSDYFSAGGTVEKLRARIAEAPPWRSPKEGGQSSRDRDWRRVVIAASALRTMTFEPLKFVLPGYITEGLTLLVGKPKGGKSWLMLDVCIAVAAVGRFVLGTVEPAHGDALYLALEDSKRRLQRRMDKLLSTFGAEWPERLKLATEWRKLDAGGLDDMCEWCRSVERPTLIVIDTLAKVRPPKKKDQGLYEADYAALEGLHKLAHEFGVAVVVVHHLNKMPAEDVFDTVSGTTGLTGAADATILIKRDTGGIVIHVRGRDIEDVEQAAQFNKESCRWTILGEVAEVRRSDERTRVVDALREAGPMSPGQIMETAKLKNRNATDLLLGRMVFAGELERVGRGAYQVTGSDSAKAQTDSTE